ncbi:MAG: SpoIVB peptidase [Oscillospiraceae bacterium]|nr:SpoIVB peptidase [Oscillospiraceae bacterium]MBQ3085144.1 SpoIVB peptidase [Clostridia bacterium]
MKKRTLLKKWTKFTAYLAAIGFLLSGFCIYVSEIPILYSCRPGEEPAGSAFYTIEPKQTETEPYTAKVKLFGLLPIKDATVREIEQKQLIVLGAPFGTKLYTKGVIVVQAEEDSPAAAAGIRAGDVILSYNNVTVTSNEALAKQVNRCEGGSQTAVVQRNERTQTVQITPAKTESGWSIGLWVRDSAAGLGTLTYYDPATNTVAGLGHSITDVDTGRTMPIQSGSLVTATVHGVRIGEAGNPGELLGSLNDTTIGTLTANTECGLFGTADYDFSGVSYPIALKDEIEVGEAQILCTVAGTTPKAYTIRITEVRNNLSETRNLCIQVTDPELLAATGGIVQGMSGSPILQNGKLIGAVTHVLLNDPTSGYGIFIENMLEAAG